MASDVTTDTIDTSEKSKQSILVRLWPIYLIAAGFGLAYSQGWHEYLTPESISENIGWLDAQVSANFALVLAIYVLIYAAATAFMVPASFLTITGGVLFGLMFGTFGTVVGATLGASTLFIAAKTSLGETLKSVAGPFVGKMQKGFNEDALSYMFALRLIPAFPFAVVNIAPAILGAKFRDYLITTFFGIIPGTLAYTWIGVAVGDTVRAGGDVNIGTLASNFIPAFVALGVVALIPVAYKKLFAKNATQLDAANDAQEG
ncbi:MAG: TVP38/TMEM64 family protein [Pseudomonadota bacterium]